MRSVILNLILLCFAQEGLSSHLEVSKESWTPLYQGVDYKLSESKNIDGASLRIHAIRVDLNNPDISFVVTPEELEPKKRTVGEFLSEFDAQVAFNGPSEDTVKISSPLDVLDINGSTNSLLVQGEPIAGSKDERVARSAVGMSADRKTLYFVVVEGGPRTGFWYKDVISMGVTAAELAQIMKNLGAHSAVDTAQNRYPILAVKNSEAKTQILNLHIDHREESPVKTHFGIKAKALETSTSDLLGRMDENLRELSKYREKIRKSGLANPVYFKKGIESVDSLYAGSQIRLSDLKKTDRKFTGEAKGGVYRDKNEVVWFVKAGYKPTSEYIGARLLHRFLYKQTPLVKLIPNDDSMANYQSEDRKYLIASRQVKGFEPIRLVKPNPVLLRQKAKLKVFMDWIGLGDRSENNQGHALLSNGYTVPARIDFDNSFDDTNGWFDWNDPNDIHKQFQKMNELNGNEKYSLSIENYSLDAMASAIEALSAVSDEEITGIVDASCKEIEFAYGYNPCKEEPFSKLSEILIARKNAAKNFDTGYQYLLRDEEGKKVHFIKIDPRKKSIEIVPTNPLDPETTSQIAKRVGARAAINGGFFNYGPFEVLKGMGKSALVNIPKSVVLSVGLIENFVKTQFGCETEECIIKFTKFLSKHVAVHAYPAFPDSSLIVDDNRVSCVSALSLGWTRDGRSYKFGELDFSEYSMNHCIHPANYTKHDREAGWAAMNYAIGIKLVLMEKGKAFENLNTFASDVKPDKEIPRTGICISKNMDWNFVVAEEMTLQQFANSMEKHNCYFGGLLDGGASSSIVHEGKVIFGGSNEKSIQKEEEKYNSLKARIAFGTARQARKLFKNGDERPVSDAIVVLDRKE